MPVCIMLLTKIIPLYFSIMLGFAAGKMFYVQRDAIARLVFYIVSPLVIFNAVLNTHIDKAILSLPLVTFVISCILCLTSYQISKRFWTDRSKNIVAFAAGSGNTGYFGLPIALLLFDEQGEGVYILAFLGMTLFESTLGFYICALGQSHVKETLLKAIKLPSLYALIFGLLFNAFSIKMHPMFQELLEQMKGTYTVLGMMVLGLGLAGLSDFKLDMKFIGMTFGTKFIVWPAIIFGMIALDSHYFGLYDTVVYQAWVLMAIVPLSVSTVIIATVVDAQPEKTAFAVILSTIFALAYVPMMFLLFLAET